MREKAKENIVSKVVGFVGVIIIVFLGLLVALGLDQFQLVGFIILVIAGKFYSNS